MEGKIFQVININNFCVEAERILNEPNAGGNSDKSEALAMEILKRNLGANSIFTEMEIEYYCMNWKKCDFVTIINNEKVGVSVTRVLPPPPSSFNKTLPIAVDQYIANLLYKKLFGLVISRAGILENCAFSRSILFAWTPNSKISKLLKLTFDYCVDLSLKEDVELIIVETEETHLRKDFFEQNQIHYLFY